MKNANDTLLSGREVCEENLQGIGGLSRSRLEAID